MKTLYSKRLFRIASTNFKTLEYTLNNILEDDGTELNYSMQDQIDDILDLPKNKQIVLKANRDDDNDFIIVERIQ